MLEVESADQRGHMATRSDQVTVAEKSDVVKYLENQAR